MLEHDEAVFGVILGLGPLAAVQRVASVCFDAEVLGLTWSPPFAGRTAMLSGGRTPRPHC